MFTLPFLTNTRAQVTALLQSDLAQKVCAEAEGETALSSLTCAMQAATASSPTPSTPSRLPQT